MGTEKTMSRNFQETKRRSWKKVRSWGGQEPFEIKHDTFIKSTVEGEKVEPNYKIDKSRSRSRNPIRNEEEKTMEDEEFFGRERLKKTQPISRPIDSPKSEEQPHTEILKPQKKLSRTESGSEKENNAQE